MDSLLSIFHRLNYEYIHFRNCFIEYQILKYSHPPFWEVINCTFTISNFRAKKNKINTCTYKEVTRERHLCISLTLRLSVSCICSNKHKDKHHEKCPLFFKIIKG